MDDDCDGDTDCDDSDCTNDAYCLSLGGLGFGGGGDTPPELIIFEEQSGETSSTSITLSWSTNIPATSRIIYDILSHSILGESPN